MVKMVATLCLACLFLWGPAGAQPFSAAGPVKASDLGNVSFRHDVMAVLSKAGCNQGVCHGNLHGKGGFKLSLRGEDWMAVHHVR